MTDITEEAATEVGEESKADEASAKKERIDSILVFVVVSNLCYYRSFALSLHHII